MGEKEGGDKKRKEEEGFVSKMGLLFSLCTVLTLDF